MSFLKIKLKSSSFRTQLEAGARLNRVRLDAQLLKHLAVNKFQPLKMADPSSGFCLKRGSREDTLSVFVL